MNELELTGRARTHIVVLDQPRCSLHYAAAASFLAMREAAERLAAGDSSARAEVADNALNYAGLLRQHIYKEDNILFPMANQVIPLGQQEKVAEGFERVEHEETGEGVHEKYLALAQALEQEISTP